jgi:hypothetical protein
MDYTSFKILLLNKLNINRMDKEDKSFFQNYILNGTIFRNLNHYIQKYNLDVEQIELLNKYNFYTRNYTENMIIPN